MPVLSRFSMTVFGRHIQISSILTFYFKMKNSSRNAQFLVVFFFFEICREPFKLICKASSNTLDTRMFLQYSWKVEL